MKLVINNKKINIEKIDGFFNRFKLMKFRLEKLENGFLLSKRKYLNTYLYCQKVDVVMTDKDNKILYLYSNLKSEKIIFFKKKAFNTYILPLNTSKYLKILMLINKYTVEIKLANIFKASSAASVANFSYSSFPPLTVSLTDLIKKQSTLFFKHVK